MCRSPASGTRRLIAAAGPEPRLEPVIAQYPQHVLGNSGGGVANEPDPARPEVNQPADEIVEGAVGVEKNRVDRKIAPRRIGRPVRVKRDAGAPAVSLDISPQCRDLEMSRRPPRNGGHRPMSKAGRHNLDAGLAQ